MFCDTIAVDSASLLLGSGFGKRTTLPEAVRSLIEHPVVRSAAKDAHVLDANIPNPFSDETLVGYSLAAGAKHAELRITTPLGQLIRTYPLQQQKGLIVIDGSQLRDGMYYYSLIVDGATVNSKVMVVGK
jgi:hypothetical protein